MSTLHVKTSKSQRYFQKGLPEYELQRMIINV